MNKIVVNGICSILALTNSITAEIEEKNPPALCPNLYTAELRAAAFVPMGQRFKDVYGTVGVSLQTEAARAFCNHPNLGVWGNVEWIFMHQKSHRFHSRSHVDIVNLSLGFKAMGHFFDDTLILSAGIGPDIGFVFLENKMRCCSSCDKKNFKEHQYRTAFGGIVKATGQYYFTQRFYFDLFADYLYLPVHFKHTVDAGGFKFGGGLGLTF